MLLNNQEAESGPYLKFGNDIRRYPENRLSNQELKISKLAEKFATRKYILLLVRNHSLEIFEIPSIRSRNELKYIFKRRKHTSFKQSGTT